MIKQFLFKSLWSLFASLFFCSFAWGQSSDRYLIKNSNGSINPSVLSQSKVSQLSRVKQATSESFGGKYFRLVQFYEFPTSEQRAAWEKQGLKLADYLSGNAYYAVIDNGFDFASIKTLVRAVLPVDGMFKKEPKLYSKASAETVSTSTEKMKLVVSYYAGLSSSEVIADLKSLGAEIGNHRDYSKQLDIVIPASLYTKIASIPYIQFVGEAPGEPTPENYTYRNSTGRSNYVNDGYNGLNYNGAGVVVGNGEGGTCDNRIDFRGRLTEMTSGGVNGHMIGCLQNMGSAGNDDPTNRNNAWGATLLALDTWPDYAALFNSMHLLFTNHSYGFSISGGYNSTARDHDLLIATYPLHIITYSSGNSGGSEGYAPYAFASWANITGQMKQNKNHIAVGALAPDDGLFDFSSRGPMYDGRIIPQLAVEGSEGTSYAAPKITGMLAILEQVYKEKHGGTEAPSTLLRTILMNTADDVENPGPDFKTGYGRPNMRRAYKVLNAAQYLSGSVANGGVNTHIIAVPANTKQVRIMLVWPDVAAAVGAAKALVNDLNLVGTSPGNVAYNPWVLDATADVAKLNLPATRGVDNVNSIEQVTVDDPAAGDWNFTVTGASVPTGPQSYFVVYEFISEELVMEFPLKDVRFHSSDSYIIKWDSYGTSGTFDLSYELDNRGTWVSLATGLDAADRNYEWKAPSFTDGIHSIKFKVQKGALFAQSDVNYVGDVPQSLALHWACADKLSLTWDAVAGATGYKVYRLGDKYMEEVTSNITYNGTSALLLNQSATANEYYAVSAVTGSNEGLRTMSFTKAVGDYNCFNVKTKSAIGVGKTNVTLKGLVNPHGTTLANVHFDYGATTAYGSQSATIAISAAGYTEEMVSATVPSSLVLRSDVMHYRLSATIDGAPVYGDDMAVSLAPGNDFTFDGVNDYINLSANPNLPICKTGTEIAYSISAWVKGAPQSDRRFYAEGNSTTNSPTFGLGATTSGAMTVFIRNDAGNNILNKQTTSTAFDNNWHHVVWVDENGNGKVYVDGNLDATNFTYTPTAITLDQAAIGAIFRTDVGYYFNGMVDELSVWNKALSVNEVRSLMHQPLNGTETGLKAYYSLDETSSDIVDGVTAQSAVIVGGGSKTASTAPFGVGAEFAASEVSGAVAFTGAGMAVNYTAVGTAATAIVSRIDIAPNATTGISGSAIFTNQYWVAHRYGSGTFAANVTFTVSESLTAADEANPSQIQLYSRNKGSDGNWDFVSVANSVNAASKTATFNGLNTFNKQFIIARNTDPFITTSVTTLPFANSRLGCTPQVFSYTLTGINLADNLIVTAPAGFEVSLSAATGFASSLTLTPVNRSVLQVVYVRFTPSTLGVQSGSIMHASTGAVTLSMTLPFVYVANASADASKAMTFNGTNQYVDVQDFNWSSASVFTIEWWMKPSTATDYNQQIGNGWGIFMFHVCADKSVYCGTNVYNRIHSVSNLITLNEWQHFAFVLNGANEKLYRNGELIGEITNSSGMNSVWGHFAIGVSGSNTLNGQLDEFRIWSSARTLDQIKDNMYRTLAGSNSDLKLYLQFNEPSGTPIDYSGNCYQVAAYNAPVTSISTAPLPYTTIADGNWSSASTWDTGQNVPVKDWVSVKVAHKVVLDQTQTVKALEATSVAQFTVNAGSKFTLASGGQLTLRSDADGTATLVDNGTMDVSAGISTMEQYLPSVRNWYMSSPVYGATAPAGNTYYKYIEAANNGTTWTPVSSGSDFDLMTGYIVKPGAATTFAFSGALNTGVKQITGLTSTATAKTGFNLVGNPYPSYVNWMSATKTNLSTTIWYRTQNSAKTPAYVFDTYNETANTGTNNNGVAAVTEMIPPMQAFWVKVNAGTTGSLAFDNNMRSHQDVTTNKFRSPAANATQQVLRLQVSNGANSDEAIVLFNTNATDGFDAYDSQKMTNGNASIPEIYTLAGTEKVVINGLNSIATNETIPLGFTTGSTNSFSIKATQASNFDADTKIVLIDNVLQAEQDISDGTPYYFTSDIASTDNRFSIVFRSKFSTTDIDNSAGKETILVSKNANNQIVVTCKRNDQAGVVMVSNAIGQKLYSATITGITTVITKSFNPGIYLVTVNEADKLVTKKVIIN